VGKADLLREETYYRVARRGGHIARSSPDLVKENLFCKIGEKKERSDGFSKIKTSLSSSRTLASQRPGPSWKSRKPLLQGAGRQRQTGSAKKGTIPFKKKEMVFAVSSRRKKVRRKRIAHFSAREGSALRSELK